MDRFSSFRYIVLLAGLLGSCAPRHYQLIPLSGDVATIDGRNVTKTEADSVVVVASYEREDMEYIALDVEIKNRSSRPLAVDPADFQVLALANDGQTPVQPARYGNVSPVRNAADPTYEAQAVKHRIEREERRLKTARVVNTVLMVATVAASVAAASQPVRNQCEYNRYVAGRVAANNAFQLVQMKRVIDHGTFASRMQRYEFEAYRWHELALHPTTVPPGESVRGFVYLPKNRQAEYLQLTYPVADSSRIALTFQQLFVKRPAN